MTCFHFDIGGRARHAGRFIGRVRAELLRALSERKSEAALSQQALSQQAISQQSLSQRGLSQQALARKLDVERSVINRQLSGEDNLTLRAVADLAWAMDMEISFELKQPAARSGQNQPMTTSTVEHGQIKYINGAAKRASVLAVPANSELGQTKKSA